MSAARPVLVAIVEDDADMRQAMRRVLETEGFVTEVFGSAEAFLASGAATQTAVLVLDIQLPAASGLELRSSLVTSGIEIPTVFVSALEERVHGIALRATDSRLVKPFAADQLVDAVRRANRRGDVR